jgi:hypothetical protein
VLVLVLTLVLVLVLMMVLMLMLVLVLILSGLHFNPISIGTTRAGAGEGAVAANSLHCRCHERLGELLYTVE